MIARVLIQTVDGERMPCILAGFGMTVCGNCNQVMKLPREGSTCLGCGAKVVSVDRVNSSNFEGEHS